MGMINLLRAIIPLMKDQKGIVGTLICSAVLAQWMIGYVDKKHTEGTHKLHEMMQKIEQTQDQVTNVQFKESESQSALVAIQRSMDTVADRLKIMDQRIWELYRESKRSRIDGQEISFNKTQEE